MQRAETYIHAGAGEKEKSFTPGRLSSQHGQTYLVGLMLRADVAAVHAHRLENGNYVLEPVGHERYRKMRASVLISAYFCSIGKNDEKKYCSEVAKYISDHKQLLFVDLGDALRVYHYR